MGLLDYYIFYKGFDKNLLSFYNHNPFYLGKIQKKRKTNYIRLSKLTRKKHGKV